VTVYVDNMMREARVGRGRPAKWSHLLADTSHELVAFAVSLGLRPEWIQHAGTHREHFDVTMSVRSKAISAGAVKISYPRGTADVLARKRTAMAS
jgi:hypothetical protein